MTQIGTIRVETQNSGTVELPVFDTGVSGNNVYEMVRVETDSGTGFIPVADVPQASYEYLRVQTQSHGVVAVHDDSNVLEQRVIARDSNQKHIARFDLNGNLIWRRNPLSNNTGTSAFSHNDGSMYPTGETVWADEEKLRKFSADGESLELNFFVDNKSNIFQQGESISYVGAMPDGGAIVSDTGDFYGKFNADGSLDYENTTSRDIFDLQPDDTGDVLMLTADGGVERITPNGTYSKEVPTSDFTSSRTQFRNIEYNAKNNAIYLNTGFGELVAYDLGSDTELWVKDLESDPSAPGGLNNIEVSGGDILWAKGQGEVGIHSQTDGSVTSGYNGITSDGSPWGGETFSTGPEETSVISGNQFVNSNLNNEWTAKSTNDTYNAGIMYPSIGTFPKYW